MKNKIVLFCGFILFFTIVNYENTYAQNVSNEIKTAITDAARNIISNLDRNSSVAFFNSSTNSTQETELSIFFIEEISSYLVNNSSLKIIERERFGIIEKEQNWQMQTGYVQDNEMIDIAHRIGAKYVVSSYISGFGQLQRIRVKIWNAQTGQLIISNSYPTNNLGVKFIETLSNNTLSFNNERTNSKLNPFIQTISENGITVDYQKVESKDSKYILIELYIDGTMFYNMFEYVCKLENKSLSYMLSTNDINFNSRAVIAMARITNENANGINDFKYEFLDYQLIEYFNNNKNNLLDARRINTIIRLLKIIITE